MQESRRATEGNSQIRLDSRCDASDRAKTRATARLRRRGVGVER